MRNSQAERSMFRLMALALVFSVGGCASFVATSGRVVIKDDRGLVATEFSDRDRAVIEGYYKKAGKKDSPPGLAKRGGGLPPGLSKRDRLPSGLEGDSLPHELEARLAPLPSEFMRARIGRDIVLMDRSTRVILDVLYGAAN